MKITDEYKTKVFETSRKNFYKANALVSSTPISPCLPVHYWLTARIDGLVYVRYVRSSSHFCIFCALLLTLHSVSFKRFYYGQVYNRVCILCLLLFNEIVAHYMLFYGCCFCYSLLFYLLLLILSLYFYNIIH